MALLEVRGLSKHFGGVAAVDGCSFDAPAGQVTGLIGPNGAGKSTAIDLISGFKIPDSGTVTFDGKLMVNISGSGDVPVFTGADGKPVAADQLDGLKEMITFAVKLFEHFGRLLKPAYRTLGITYFDL